MEKGSFEERLDRVRGIIEAIESGNKPLEESVKQFESGMKILNELDQELEQIKRRVTVLQEKPDGTQEEKPLEGII